jgi:membrane associated rhomboid family serine protease
MARGSGLPVIEVLVVFLVVFVVQLVTALANLVGSLFVLSAPLAENPWTIPLSVYAHGSINHLLSNAIALILFGWPVARATTRPRFHVFFVVTGSIAGISQIYVSESLASAPLIGGSASVGVLGASGAVFALLGYFLASNRLSSTLGSFLSVPRWLRYAAFVIIAILLTMATAQPGVALIAHFIGLLLGLVAGRFNLLRVS